MLSWVPRTICRQEDSISSGGLWIPNILFFRYVFFFRFSLSCHDTIFWIILNKYFKTMSPWTDHLLWEAPGRGTVGKTGSRKVTEPQGNPTVWQPGIKEPVSLGGRMLMTRNDPFLKQSALCEGPHKFIPPFIHSFLRSTHQNGLFCDRFSCRGMGVGAQGRPEAVGQLLRPACVFTLCQFLKIMSMCYFSNQKAQS